MNHNSQFNNLFQPSDFIQSTSYPKFGTMNTADDQLGQYCETPTIESSSVFPNNINYSTNTNFTYFEDYSSYPNCAPIFRPRFSANITPKPDLALYDQVNAYNYNHNGSFMPCSMNLVNGVTNYQSFDDPPGNCVSVDTNKFTLTLPNLKSESEQKETKESLKECENDTLNEADKEDEFMKLYRSKARSKSLDESLFPTNPLFTDLRVKGRRASLNLDSETKHEIRKYRNRIAAFKCRERKREFIENHDIKMHELEVSSSYLMKEVNELQNEAVTIHRLLNKCCNSCLCLENIDLPPEPKIDFEDEEFSRFRKELGL